MNLNLKAVYYCATSNRRWGKGLTMEEAMKAAGIKSFTEKNVDFYIQAAMFNDPKPEELESLRQCIVANEVHGSPEFYKQDRTPEDDEQIKRLHVGWITLFKTKGVSV